MKIFIFIILFFLGGFLLISQFMTKNFVHYCGGDPESASAQACTTGFSCITRSQSPTATGTCVFATDIITTWQIRNGTSPLDELQSEIELIDMLNSAESCGEMQNYIENELDKLNYCESTAECAKVELSCPLACSALVNATYRDRVELMQTSFFSRSCTGCVNDCSLADQGSIECVDNRCIYSNKRKPIFGDR